MMVIVESDPVGNDRADPVLVVDRHLVADLSTLAFLVMAFAVSIAVTSRSHSRHETERDSLIYFRDAAV
jgi:hypothetical protein